MLACVLAALERDGGEMLITDLMAESGMNHPSLKAALAGLEARGLVRGRAARVMRLEGHPRMRVLPETAAALEGDIIRRAFSVTPDGRRALVMAREAFAALGVTVSMGSGVDVPSRSLPA